MDKQNTIERLTARFSQWGEVTTTKGTCYAGDYTLVSLVSTEGAAMIQALATDLNRDPDRGRFNITAHGVELHVTVWQ